MSHDFTPNTPVQHLELITETQKGNQEAFAKLLEAYMPLIHALCRQYGASLTSAQDLEDLHQEGCIAFHSAALHFQAERGQIAFGAYARLCIKHKMVSVLRELQKHGHTVLLDDAEISDGQAEENPAQKLVEEETYLELSQLIQNTLSDYENKIWKLYLSGRTAKEIAEQLQKDEHSVQNAVYRIRKKLRAVIPNP